MEPNCAALAAMAQRAHESAPAALVELLKTSDFAHGQWELFKEAGRFLSLAAAGGNSVRHCWDALSWRPPGGRGDGADLAAFEIILKDGDAGHNAIARWADAMTDAEMCAIAEHATNEAGCIKGVLSLARRELPQSSPEDTAALIIGACHSREELEGLKTLLTFRSKPVVTANGVASNLHKAPATAISRADRVGDRLLDAIFSRWPAAERRGSDCQVIRLAAQHSQGNAWWGRLSNILLK